MQLTTQERIDIGQCFNLAHNELMSKLTTFKTPEEIADFLELRTNALYKTKNQIINKTQGDTQ